MGTRARRPDDRELERLLRRCRGQALTYDDVGVSLDPARAAEPRDVHRWATEVGGADTYEAAVHALRTWEVHRGAGLSVLAEGPAAPGVHVALSAPLPVGFVDATCRVVAVVDEPDRWGFAYGTLPIHPEQGEEAFVVERTPDGVVRFTVDAVARPVHPLARLAPPVARRLQDAAVRRYLSAMRSAVTTPQP